MPVPAPGFHPVHLLRGAALAVLTFAAPAFAGTLTIDTAKGPVEVTANPDRIVAMDVAVIDTLSALGVTPAGIVSPLYVSFLDDQMDGARTVGTLFEPDFEKIAALGPDLIILGGRSSSQAGPLSSLAPVVDMTIGLDALAEGMARLQTYGDLTGTRDKADKLAQALQAKADRARALIDGHGNALIVMTNGPKLSVFGAGSRFGWLHSALNWPEAASGLTATPHGEVVTFEFLAEIDPDTLIVIDRGQAVGGGADNARATLDNDLVRGTKAWRSGQVIYLSPAEIYVAAGGVQSLNRTLDELIAALDAGS